MFVFILFIILIAISTGIIYHFYNMCYLQKRQLMLLTKQNNSLKENINSSKMKSENITLLYKSTNYAYGVIENPCKLHISPLKNSPVLCILDKNLDIEILDSVEVYQEIWYEIRFFSKTNINNKGWISDDNISIFKNNILQKSIT